MAKNHRLDEPYDPMSREIAQNPTLSMEALGVYAYARSLPEGWDVSVESIAATKRIGMKRCRDAVAELRALNLWHTITLRAPGGSFESRVYVTSRAMDEAEVLASGGVDPASVVRTGRPKSAGRTDRPSTDGRSMSGRSVDGRFINGRSTGEQERTDSREPTERTETENGTATAAADAPVGAELVPVGQNIAEISRPTANRVVQVYVDTWRETRDYPPPQQTVKQVGAEAKRLLADPNMDLWILRRAVEAAARKGFATVTAEIGRLDSTTPTSNRPGRFDGLAAIQADVAEADARGDAPGELFR